jgi:hypothetical protein
MKKFIGYYIIGATTKQDAQDEKGLLLWTEKKPSALRRFLCSTLLGIYWIDKERILEERGKTAQSKTAGSNKPFTEMQKLAPVKTKKPSVDHKKPIILATHRNTNNN